MTAKLKPLDVERIEERLLDGHYDRLLEEFQDQIDTAAAALRHALEALRRENTLVS